MTRPYSVKILYEFSFFSRLILVLRLCECRFWPSSGRSFVPVCCHTSIDWYGVQGRVKLGSIIQNTQVWVSRLAMVCMLSSDDGSVALFSLGFGSGVKSEDGAIVGSWIFHLGIDQLWLNWRMWIGVEEDFEDGTEWQRELHWERELETRKYLRWKTMELDIKNKLILVEEWWSEENGRWSTVGIQIWVFCVGGSWPEKMHTWKR
ncbi:hypothetical protein V6N12_030684 [Hibiscus sabdariffa]|uniref:Uncharacterized protein n=1 Tax=Hibiscus sabdariffa TaxID=183260 RepID=A0ABR2E787_9ROSI